MVESFVTERALSFQAMNPKSVTPKENTAVDRKSWNLCRHCTLMAAPIPLLKPFRAVSLRWYSPLS